MTSHEGDYHLRRFFLRLPRLREILLELGDFVLQHSRPRLGNRPLVGLVGTLGLEGLEGLLEEGGVERLISSGGLPVCDDASAEEGEAQGEKDVTVHG